MAGNVIACGEAGAGIAAKLVNNMMLFISVMAVSEGSQLAEQLGLDPQVFWDVARVSSADSWALRTWYPVPGIVEKAAANKNFDATFSVELARKDCALAVQAGDDTGVHLPAARLALGQLDDLIAEGLGARTARWSRASPRRTAPSAATTRRVTASPRPDPAISRTPRSRGHFMTTASASATTDEPIGSVTVIRTSSRANASARQGAPVPSSTPPRAGRAQRSPWPRPRSSTTSPAARRPLSAAGATPASASVSR
jgi:hypothetical protein